MVFTVTVFGLFAVAASFQRISGMGFSLVALPGLLWLIGPLDAVTLVVITSALTSLLMVFGTAKEIVWKNLVRLAIPSVVIAFPTLYLLNHSSERVISLLVGALLAVCTGSLMAKTRLRSKNTFTTELVVGAVSGFMNATAGVAGPAIGAYAFSSGWSYRTFVATAQPYFIIADVGVLIAKSVFPNPDSSSLLSFSVIAVAALGCFLGLWIGAYVSKYITEKFGKVIVIGISAAGAVITIVKAVMEFT